MKAELLPKEILFLKSNINYTLVYYKSGKVALLSYTLKKVEQELARTDESFLRIHRSFLVNEKHIIQSSNKSVLLSNGKVLPIARRRNIEIS